jgi:hypothetical protein
VLSFLKRRKNKYLLGIAAAGSLVALLSLVSHPCAEIIRRSSGYAPIHQIHKDLRADHGSRTFTAVLNQSDQFPARHPASIFEEDYKQNLLIWPVVAWQTIRSPPSVHNI